MEFRKDINGLRAIAVMAVVLYHFDVTGFNGGFVGVDVFFVISGFLMTSIIFDRFDSGVFSLIGFYFDRARRIVPALSVMCLAVMMLGFVILIPSDFETLSKHAISSMTFISNFQYLSESSYFDVGAKQKWLLHTWSLSAEWQFYVIYPVAIMLAKKIFTLKNIKVIIVAAFIASLAASIFFSKSHPSGSFYMLHSRAWEMLAGAIVYLFPLSLSPLVSWAVKTSGILLVLSSIFILKTTDVWPGYLAMLPVLGACLVVASKNSSSFITNNFISQFIGNISYSVYLWHWPVVVYLSCSNMKSDQDAVLGIFVSLAFGVVSYFAIESPARKMAKKLQGKSYLSELSLITLISLISVIPGVYVYANDGVPSRFPFAMLTNEQMAKEELKYSNFWESGQVLHLIPKTGDRKVLIIGDSLGIDLGNALYESGFKGEITNLQKLAECGNYGRTASDGAEQKTCDSNYKAITSYKDYNNYDAIFLHESLRVGNLVDFEKSIMDIRSKTNAPIYVFGPKMMYQKAPSMMVKLAMDARKTSVDDINVFTDKFYMSQVSTWNERYREIIESEKYKAMNIHFIDTLNVQCGEELKCRILSEKGKDFLYFDPVHYTTNGAKDFGGRLKNSHPELYTDLH